MSFSHLEYCSSQCPTHGVVLLHGWGGNAQDFMFFAEALDRPQIKFLFPHAPYPHPFSPTGRMWYDLKTGEHLSQTRTDLKTWVRSLPELLKIPLENIILGGFSQGGAMTLEVGHDLPLAGLLCLSGYLHPHLQFSEKDAKPTLIIHGTQDPVVPLHAAQDIREKLRKAQWSPNFYELPMTHEVSPQAIKKIRGFLNGVCNL